MCACTSATVRHAVTATQDRGSKTNDHEPLGVVERRLAWSRRFAARTPGLELQSAWSSAEAT